MLSANRTGLHIAVAKLFTDEKLKVVKKEKSSDVSSSVCTPGSSACNYNNTQCNCF